MRHSRGEMYSSRSRLCVCLSFAAFPHYCTNQDVTLGNGMGCPLVVHCWADLQSDTCFVAVTTVPNGKCQRVLVLALCLVQLLLLCCASDDVGPVDCTVDLVVEFIKSQLTTDDGSTRRLRGPYLAQLELMRLLRDRHDNRWNTAFGGFFRSGNTPDEDACLFVRDVLVL